VLLGDVADVHRGELGEVTAAAAAIGNHLKLRHREQLTASSSPRPRFTTSRASVSV
jgi:hypothetical protein